MIYLLFNVQQQMCHAYSGREQMQHFLVGSMLLILKYFVVCCPFMCLSVLSFLIKTMFGSSLPQLFTGGFMSYLRDLFAHSGVQHIVCCVFLHFVYPVLTVSLDFSFLIALSVLSNVY